MFSILLLLKQYDLLESYKSKDWETDILSKTSRSPVWPEILSGLIQLLVGPAFYPCVLLGMGLVGRQFSQVWSQSVEKTLGQANYDVVSSGLSSWEKMRNHFCDRPLAFKVCVYRCKHDNVFQRFFIYIHNVHMSILRLAGKKLFRTGSLSFARWAEIMKPSEKESGLLGGWAPS